MKTMKKLITLVIVLGLAGGGYFYYESQKPPQVPEFMKVTVSEGNVVESVSATGTLKAVRTVPVGSQISGVVEEVYADFNSIVRQGQVLVKIDTSILETQVQIQEANIARQGVELASQRVQLEDLERNLARTKELYEKKLVTQQALEAAELQVKSRVAQIASAEKSMVQTQFQVEQAKKNVEYATVRSPIDGVVISRAVDQGQTVQSSQNVATLFLLATDLTTLKLEGGVDESEIGKVRQGMRVVFTVDAYPNREFEGTITMVQLNPTTQSNVVTYTTVAEVKNNDLSLRTGMTASMRIIVAQKNNVLRIPNAALRFRPTNDMYKVLGQEPPTPAGRAGGARGRAGNDGAAPAAPGAAATGTTPATRPAATPATPQVAAADGARRGNPFETTGRTWGRGQGGGLGATLTPEQQKQLEAIRNLPADQRQAAMARAGISFGGGGRGDGQGRGGRGGNSGQTAAAPPLTQRNASAIDELFAPLLRTPTRGQVYVLTPADATHKFGTLTRLDIQQGITDGTFTELVSIPAEMAVGTELVTSILMPWLQVTTTGTTQGNPFSGQQPGRGGMPGGGMPGGGGGRGGGR